MPPAAMYSITVRIEQKTLDILRADPQKVLVLVRDIGLGDEVVNGNIVFATYGSKELSSTQTFIWEELYSIAETTSEFKPGFEVRSGTDSAAILRGQTAEFKSNSTVDVTGQSDPTGDINALNNWKNGAHVIVACKSVDSSGADVITPHYISAKRVLGDESALTPVTSFSVLVVSSTKTKTMIDVTRGVTGRFEIAKGKLDCEVLYDTFTGSSLKDQWKATKNATKLN